VRKRSNRNKNVPVMARTVGPRDMSGCGGPEGKGAFSTGGPMACQKRSKLNE
jgi:hypothetical protein